MALFRSTRRLSLKTLLRDATVMMAGTVLGILLSHLFFADKSGRAGVDLESLCAGSNTQLPHLAKRSDGSFLKDIRSRVHQPRPLPAIWGAVMNEIDVATDRARGGELEGARSGSGGSVEGSGQPLPPTHHFEDTSPQTTGSLLPLHEASNGMASSADNERTPSNSLSLQNQEVEEKRSKLHNSLVVGVLASDLSGYTAVIKTWGSYVQKLVYFSSMAEEEGDVPVVNPIRRVDGHTHQPRMNAYQLLKYLHDNFADNYGWFMRTSDNVYVQVERLTNYLTKLDSNREQCFGYLDSGRHKTNSETEQYSVGGPVTIFSRGLLKKLGPHLGKCLMNATTSESNDVDTERCLKERVEFQCGRNSEISQLFMTDHSNGEIFIHPDDPDAHTTHQLLKALTVHPIPSPHIMLRAHQVYLKSAINKLKSRTNQLASELERLTSSMSS